MSRLLLIQKTSATAVCLLGLLAPSNVSAQRTSVLPDPSEWGYRQVYVEDVGGSVSFGAVREIRSDSLFLQLAEGGERAYAASEIWRIDRQGDSLWNGLLIGVGLASLGGVKILSQCGAWCLELVIPGVGLGGLVGVAYDAMVPGRTTVYRAPSSAGSFPTAASALALGLRRENRVDRLAFAIDPQIEQDRVMAVGLAGLLGAAVGFAGGAYLGSEAERKWYPCQCDDPGLAGALLGLFVGPVIVTPLATHLANERRGSLVHSYAVAAAIAGMGFLGLGSTLASSDTFVFLATPVAHAIGATAIELATGR